MLDELGDKFPHALVTATDGAREDLQEMRTWKPSWFPSMFQREIAGVVHARIWARLQQELDGVGDIKLVTREPFREVHISTLMGRTYTLRVKRHREGDRISSYSTLSDVEFWGGVVATFDGMEEVSLAAGYRWNSLSGTVGQPVISYREGKENIIWAVELDHGVELGAPLRRTPILPTLPVIDLAGADEDETVDGVE